MALPSPQQLRQGLPSPEELKKRNQGLASKTAGTIGNLALGFGKGLVSTPTQGSALLQRGGSALGGGLAGLVKGEGFKSGAKRELAKINQEGSASEQIIPERARTPEGTAQKIGFGIEQFGEFILPAGAVTKAGKAIQGSRLVSKAPKAYRGALTLAGLSGLEGASFGGVTALQKGKVDKEVGTAALVGAAFPVVGAGVKAGYGKFIKPKLIKNLNTKAEKLATEILQPGKSEIKLAKMRGTSTSKTVKEYVKSVQVAENFDDAVKQLKETLANDFSKRNNLLKKKNFTLKQERVFEPLEQHIKNAEKKGLTDPKKIQEMKRVLQREKQWLKNNNPDRVAGQIRKEAIYDEAAPIYKKIDKGTLTGAEEGRAKAFELLGKGYKKTVEAGDDAIRLINESYGGKKGAIELLAGRGALADKAMTPTAIQKLFMPVFEFISQSTGAGSASFVAKLALKQEQNLATLTKKLFKLSKAIQKRESDQAIANAINTIIKDKTKLLPPPKAGAKAKDVPFRLGAFIKDEARKGVKPPSGRPPQKLLPPGGKVSGQTIRLPKESLSTKEAKEALRRKEGIIKKLLEAGKQSSKTPKTVRIWKKSKFSTKGHYEDLPVIRKEKNITLYQGSKPGDRRQFWTKDKKYAEKFGKVRQKTGTFYEVDNGNRVVTVYVEA